MTPPLLELEVDGRAVTVTNPDRVLWPATGFTKGQMVDYYRAAGEAVVRHLRGRPLMLGRWPLGIADRGFGQLECRGRPDWMASCSLRLRSGERVETCVVNDVASLVWLANQGVVELHPYLARCESFSRPVAVVFDLDPGPPAGVGECAEVALALRERLLAAGLESVAKLSGGGGIHVFVPLNTEIGYAETKRFARDAAAALARLRPELVTDRMSRALRGGRVLIDWNQNDERKQTVAAYSLRATNLPAVSAPLRWDEVGALCRGDDALALVDPTTTLARLHSIGDPFAPAATLQQRL